MRRPWVWVAVLVQLGLLLWIAGQREWIVANGETLWLRTSPVDPRDIFRGDYVRLDYDISTLGANQLAHDLQEGEQRIGEVVYVSLKPGPDGLAEALEVSRSKPAQGPFLRGRIEQDWRFREQDAIRVKYGIEKYFVEQGSGLVIEERRGNRNEIQTPMEVEVARSSGGVAALKGYRWSRLGIGLERSVGRPAELASAEPSNIDADNETSVQAAQQEDPPPVFRLALQNVSESPLSLALLPNDCSFSVTTLKWSPQPVILDPKRCDGVADSAAEIVTLSPQQRYPVVFDFLGEERWFVSYEGKPVPISELPRNYRFRIHYLPPDLPDQGPELWRGRLPSSAFHGTGQID